MGSLSRARTFVSGGTRDRLKHESVRVTEFPYDPNRIAVMARHRRTVMCAVASMITERVTQYVVEEGKGNRWSDDQNW